MSRQIESLESRRLLAGIQGTVFEDVYNPLAFDAEEAGIPGFTVELLDAQDRLLAFKTSGFDADGNGTIDDHERGAYRFTGLAPGDYRVRISDLALWNETRLVADVPSLQGSAIVDFPVQPAHGYDWGDLWPDTYLTTRASVGARALIDPSGSWLGTIAPDAEDNGRAVILMSGDDHHNVDDEDALVAPILVPGRTITLSIPCHVGAGRTLHGKGWIDFDGNDRLDANEAALDWTIANPGPAGQDVIAFVQVQTPADAVSGSTGLRLRVADQPIESPWGLSMSGEVEDYLVTVGGPAGAASVGVWRDGTWYMDVNNDRVWDPAGGDFSLLLGRAGDIPVTGDFNGDGYTDQGVYRDGNFILLNTPSLDVAWNQLFPFGLPGDRPVVGDWNGDGVDDLGIVRGAQFCLDTNGNMRFDPPGSTNPDRGFTFGFPGDEPIAGDWLNDGIDSVGIFRQAIFATDSNDSLSFNPVGDIGWVYGLAQDRGVVGDFNGDGRTESGVFRRGHWSLDAGGTPTDPGDDIGFDFGLPSDTPVIGRWLRMNAGLHAAPITISPRPTSLSGAAPDVWRLATDPDEEAG